MDDAPWGVVLTEVAVTSATVSPMAATNRLDPSKETPASDVSCVLMVRIRPG
ncbi:hypothetical protein ACQE2J_04335 [Brevibacterium sp. LE-L]|uniref:hypothetical protein n=1 Tax=unclassified Brevibacterium TaxID=2614124 RepID=UPI003CED6D6F